MLLHEVKPPMSGRTMEFTSPAVGLHHCAQRLEVFRGRIMPGSHALHLDSERLICCARAGIIVGHYDLELPRSGDGRKTAFEERSYLLHVGGELAAHALDDVFIRNHGLLGTIVLLAILRELHGYFLSEFRLSYYIEERIQLDADENLVLTSPSFVCTTFFESPPLTEKVVLDLLDLKGIEAVVGA